MADADTLEQAATIIEASAPVRFLFPTICADLRSIARLLRVGENG